MTSVTVNSSGKCCLHGRRCPNNNFLYPSLSSPSHLPLFTIWIAPLSIPLLLLLLPPLLLPPHSPFSQFLFFRDDLKASNFLCGVSVVITVLFELPLFALSERVLSKCGTRGLITVSHLAYVNGVNMSMLYWFRGSLSRVYVYVCVCVVHI